MKRKGMNNETENVNEETEKNTAATDAPAGTEDENIVLYAKKGSQDYCPLNEVEYELHEGEVTATEDILLYNEKGYCVGYIKNGAAVSITEYGSGWTRFKNPIDGTDYDYLYVLRDYVTDLELFRVTASDIQQKLVDYINSKPDMTLCNYMTYYVECEEDTDGWIICRLYYKDAYDLYQN